MLADDEMPTPLDDPPRDLDDATAWRVWADYLQSRGDPRGECIALELAGLDASAQLAMRALPALPTPDEWRAAVREPAARLDSGWPRLDAMIDTIARAHPELLACRWRYGMLEAVGLTDPWHAIPTLPESAALLEGVLAAPCAAALRRLALDRHSPDNVASGEMGKRGLAEWARPILERVELPALHELKIGDDDEQRVRLSRFSSYMLTTEPPGRPGARIVRPDRWIGDLSWLLARTLGLRRLDVCGEGVSFSEPLQQPELERLRIRTRFLRASAIEALGRSELPKLHTLELWLGNWPDSSLEFEGPEPAAYYGPEPEPELLRPLLTGDRLPALRRLALRHCAYGDGLLAFLVEAEVLQRPGLEHLDLSNSYLAVGAGLLADRANPVSVARLDLSHCEVFPHDAEDLRTRFGDRIRLDD